MNLEERQWDNLGDDERPEIQDVEMAMGDEHSLSFLQHWIKQILNW